ncbi:MAG TPA: hypothetical protein VEI26_09370 [Terriglobales bacterium]|nr:hypothetical protein [Terriglobales bacterium]
MKHSEVITGHLSPCLRIFIESLLHAELPTSEARDAGATEDSMDIKKVSRTLERPELQRSR